MNRDERMIVRLAVALAVTLVLFAIYVHKTDARLDRLENARVPVSLGKVAPEPEATPWVEHHRPATASRSRAVVRHAAGGVGGLNWTALAACESSGDPRAVSPSGTYRGAFQMDRDFWRTYGGLRYAARPDLATYAEQLEVAKAGYAARGREPWPVCGRRL